MKPSVLFVCLALSACGVTESEDPEVQEPSAAAREEGLSKTSRPLHKFIEKRREELRAAPARTGILAEEKLYSVYDEELIIRDFFQDRRGGFFLDVGCAWPVRASNTYYLEKHLNWTGIGVDALADYAPLWARERPNSKFFSFLVTNRSNIERSFFKSENKGLSSMKREAAQGRPFGMDLKVDVIRVPSITLDDLLDREGVTKVDRLSMDIEGHELRALEGFDIQRFSPDLVVIEGGRGWARSYFTQNGYELIERYVPFDSANVYFRPVDPAGKHGVAPEAR